MPTADPNGNFPQTRWTLVQIVKSDDKKQSAAALGEICENYWYPIYAYLRRSGYAAHDAEDLTQAVFQRIIEDDAIQQVRQERGRLRSFLIGMVGRAISRQARHDEAQKRGGGQALRSLDETDADGRYTNEPVDNLDAQRLYERAWARQLLESVREKLRDAFVNNGRLADFEALEPYLGWEENPAPYAELAERLGSNENAVRVLVHRLRKKFRDLLEAEISRTVLDERDIVAELAWVREALGR